ncbi:cyclin-U1-1-like [Cucurbita pepo subsp. pepo]|uniref:cyclin-U1-1-like n=1 Tax=Cucurbita pepo subsp. pepo TaxID=3664 RepID=UPI000C9D4313|nr:cyclin-U1-1-like [Cucurbita pepo subsp. pepo]
MLTGNDFPANGLAEGDNVAEPTPRVLIILACVLDRLVARNDRIVDGITHQIEESSSCGTSHIGNSFNAFHGVRAPAISILKYLERIYKYTNCSPSCLVVGFVYIDRLIHRHPNSLVISLNVHRLLVTSVMVASKILDDVHYNNAFYARVGGVNKVELNKLELELLFLLDFGVTVSSRAFETYCLHLEKEMLLNGNGELQRIERPLMATNSLDDVSEISVDDTLASSSPP